MSSEEETTGEEFFYAFNAFAEMPSNEMMSVKKSLVDNTSNGSPTWRGRGEGASPVTPSPLASYAFDESIIP